MEPSDPLPPQVLHTGLQIIGDSGSIMIDENYRNLAIRSSGVLVDQYGDGSELISATNTTTAFLAINYPGQLHFITGSGVRDTNGNTLWVIQGAGAFVNLRYWIIDVSELGSGGTYGLQVFNAAGQLCFDSNHKQCRFIDHRSLHIQGWDGVVTYPAGRTYAVVMLQPFSQIQYQWYWDQWTAQWLNLVWYYDATATISGTTVTYGWLISGGTSGYYPPGIQVGYNPPLTASALIIDVTGY